MQEAMIKSVFVLGIWFWSQPSFFSIITSIVASIYFLSMLKVNVIDKKYDRSWKNYIKSIFKKTK